METRSYSPANPPLSLLADVIWYSRAADFNYRNQLLPMLQQELVINISDHFEVRSTTGILTRNEPSWLAGLQTSPLSTQTGGRHFTAGILLKPWGLQAITGIDALTFRNKNISLEAVFGREALLLREQLYHARDAGAIFTVLEHFLLKQWKAREIPERLISGLKTMEQLPMGSEVLKTLQTFHGWSSKTWIYQFKKYLGLSPAKYHHLLVLEKVLKHLSVHQQRSLSASTYDLDFFDQSHFIHFFRKYTGLTPREYLKYLQEDVVQPGNLFVINT